MTRPTNILNFLFIGLLALCSCKKGDTFDQSDGSPAIKITSTTADHITGTASGWSDSHAQVVLWAKTDQWYVQPWIDQPFTSIISNGTWESYTHPWRRVVALLVTSQYVPGATRLYHPASDSGILAWDEYPSNQPDRLIEFSSFRWVVKAADLAGPGPNYFSDDPTNVRVDEDGLHLKIIFRNGHWYCAETFLDHSLGYGIYTTQMGSRLDSLDFNAVAAAFIYALSGQEVDLEWSQVLASPKNAQYVVQPYTTLGNIMRYQTPALQHTSHRFTWSSSSIVFTSWRGWGAFPPPADSLIQTWTYRGSDIPTPGTERMRFNLWLFNGSAPRSNYGDEMIVKSFHYQP